MIDEHTLSNKVNRVPDKGYTITPEQLKAISPHITDKKVEVFLPYINKYADAYEVNTPLRMAAFLAQVLHESGCFTYVREIASGAAYEGRVDLGNVEKGDGKLYKGRALIQITGRTNYKALSKYLFQDENTLLKNPDMIATPEYAVIASYWFWSVYAKLNDLADKSMFKTITKRINGGFNHLKERTELYEAAKKALA